ncbi:MAG TPA: FGGY family carbohydrate kinase [Acetobacteraceae bacterium]|nr:FGGY family carbohydrate kinase [Acetobacteraceae bacterium]
MGNEALRADCLIGIDIGTQSLRGLLIDRSARLRVLASRPTPTLRMREGSAEHDPEALWQATLAILRELAPQVPKGHAVAGIAAASFGESCVLLDAHGQALGKAMAWFDRRTERDAAWLTERIGPERLFALTGLAPDPTYTLFKLLWARRTMPDRFGSVRRMLNIADWIAFRLSGEVATDFSLASRTACLDLPNRIWSAALLREVGFDIEIFPPIRASGTALGPVRPQVLAETGLPGSPIVGVGAHDHVCGAFSAGALSAGALSNGVVLDSMGTAEAILTAMRQPVMSPDLLRQGYAQGAAARDRPLFYLGGTIYSSGGAVEWTRRLFGQDLSHQALIGEAELLSPGSNGVSFLPHLAYGAPPHADITARGAFLGLTSAKGRSEMFRAVLEGLAMEARSVVAGMTDLAGLGEPEAIIVIGGNTRNRLLLEIKASTYGRPMTVIAEPEATALGAALLGGIAAGLWPDLRRALAEIERETFVVDPCPDWIPIYDEYFNTVHARLYAALQLIHAQLAKYEVPALPSSSPT